MQIKKDFFVSSPPFIREFFSSNENTRTFFFMRYYASHADTPIFFVSTCDIQADKSGVLNKIFCL